MTTSVRDSRVLVTGANGFVGSALLSRMVSDGMRPRAAVRQPAAVLPVAVETVCGAKLDSGFDWRPALEGVDAVVHAAARVHQMQDLSPGAAAAFHEVNVQGSLRLARQAAEAGVRRFVFLSSIKVNGERTYPGKPFTPEDPPAPADAYARSKAEAEDGLRALAAETGLEVVIVRPVLAYGPGVKANVLSMLRWLDRGIPLPFGAICNQRSLVGLDNLVDLLVTCVRHPAAANRALLVSDGEDLSTPDLVRRMAFALGRVARLIPVPTALLRAGAAAVGRGELARRLTDSLQVDITATRTLLGWSPPVSVDAGLAKTAAAYLARGTR